MSAVLRSDPRPTVPVGSAQRLLGLTFRTHAAGRQLRRLLCQAVERWQVSDSETLVLWLCSQPADDLQQAAGKVQGDMAVALGISPAQMSGLIERLHQRGLVTSERSNLDRRRQIWRLTHEGETLLRQLEAAAGDLARQIDSGISSAEQQQTDAALQRLIDAASHRPRLRTFTSENDHHDETPCEGGAQ